MRGFGFEVVANASIGQPDPKKATPGSLDGLSEGECTRTLEVIVSIEFKEQRITDDHSGCCVVVGH
jgi:hypothetical protein